MKIIYKSRVTKKQADIICAVYHFYSLYGKGPNSSDIHNMLGKRPENIRGLITYLRGIGLLVKIDTFPISFLPSELIPEQIDSHSEQDNEDSKDYEDGPKNITDGTIASNLEAIKFLTLRDKCYPTADSFASYTGRSLMSAERYISVLARAKLIVYERQKRVINRLIPVGFPCEIVPGRYLLSREEANALCAIYHACHILRKYPTIAELSNLTGHGEGRTNKYVNALITLGLVAFEGNQPYGVKPLLHTPKTDLAVHFGINETEAGILRLIYNQCSESGNSPVTKDIIKALGVKPSEIYSALRNLRDNGILMKDISVQPYAHYFIEGNGCDHISYPPHSVFYKRISKDEADFLNRLYCLKHDYHSVILSSVIYQEMGDLYSKKEISHNINALIEHDLLTKPHRLTYKLAFNNIPTKKNAVEKYSEGEAKPLNANQKKAMQEIREHILRFGISPKPRQIVCDYKTLVKKKYIYLADGETNSKIRVFHGVGFDDVAGDLPVETELTSSVYQTIVDCISEYVAKFGYTREDVIAGRVRSNCLTTVAEVAERSGLSEGEMDNCLSVLRLLGKLRGSRDNRYQLSNKYITLA